MSEFLDPSIREAVLQKMRLSRTVRTTAELLNSRADWRLETDIFQSTIVSVVTFVWAEQPKSITVKWPRDWWQHLKHHWFPKWALSRWPVKYSSETLEARFCYPLLPQTCEENTAVLHMRVLENPNAAVLSYEKTEDFDFAQRFHETVNAHITKTGKAPSRLRLGRHEEAALRKYIEEQGFNTRYAPLDEEPEFCGIKLEFTRIRSEWRLIP